MKNNKQKYIIGALALLPLLTTGCKESWLDPKPLSFYTPENTYVDAEGMYSAIVACERNMRHEFFGDQSPILTEYYTSDVAVNGKTDESGALVDFDNYMLPTQTQNNAKNKMQWYWDEGFKGIKYANIVLSRIDAGTYKDEAERNAVLGTAYFQRAYRYYKLTHQFGNVPFLDREYTEPKLDFYSHDRWSILEQLKKDLEFAYEWVPEKVDRGRTSKAACGVLLMKVAMCLGDFDRAIEIGKEIVANHPLMTARFTSNKNKPNTNLMHDLHSVEAKMDMSNTEGLMYVVSYPDVEGRDRIQTMRNATPYWAKGAAIVTPDGKTGTAISPAAADKGTEIDNDLHVGRGIGSCRANNYLQYDIWGEKEKNDLRSPNASGSWRRMTDLYYNDPGLKGKSEWYGKHLVRPTNMSVSDSVRCWFSWPHYKLFVPDPTKDTDRSGGETAWYIYRSAEVYLLMGECYYWKDQLQEAANMLNVVRERAGLNISLRNRTGNNQRGTGIVNQHGVDLIDNRVMMLALYQIFRVNRHVIPQIVETEFIIRSESNICLISLPSLRGIRLRLVNTINRQPVEHVKRSHPLGVTFCQVIIDRNHVYPPTCQGIQEYRQGSHQRFTFTGSHLGNLTLV